MAKRRSFFIDPQPTPASPMTPSGGSRMMHGDADQAMMPMTESPETFRRRTTPVMGPVAQQPSTLQELLAMLNGAQ